MSLATTVAVNDRCPGPTTDDLIRIHGSPLMVRVKSKTSVNMLAINDAAKKSTIIMADVYGCTTVFGVWAGVDESDEV